MIGYKILTHDNRPPLRGGDPGDPQKLTTGIRDAYRNGLGIAIPTGPEELGWTMEAE